MKLSRIVFLALLMGSSGCRLTEPLPLPISEAEKIIAEAIPKGTTVEEARKRMERRGFKCAIMTPLAKKETYLSCYTTGPGLIVVRQWSVSFEIVDGKVGEGRVSSDLLGP